MSLIAVALTVEEAQGIASALESAAKVAARMNDWRNRVGVSVLVPTGR